MDQSTDILSPVARQILKLDVAAAYSRLVVDGQGNPDALGLLQAVSSADLFIVGAKKSEEHQKAALAALWLWHDWLDQSHTISQSLPSATGSFWHAIMHRREGDFGNSKYWYAKAGDHPALAIIASQAAPVVNRMPADRHLLRIVATGFNPAALVDLVEAVYQKPNDPRFPAAVALQQLEWRVLFDFCTRA